MYRFFIFLFILIFTENWSYGQEAKSIVFKLDSKTYNAQPKGMVFAKELAFFSSIFDTTKTNQFKHIPDSLSEGIIKYIDFQNSLKEIKVEVGIKENDNTKQKEERNQNTIREGDAPETVIHEQRFHFLIGTNLMGKRVIIVDENNNLDFGDDTVFILDSVIDKNRRIPLALNVRYLSKGLQNTIKAPLFLIPFDNYAGYDNDLENKFSVAVFGRESKFGTTQFGADSLYLRLNYPVSYLLDETDDWRINIGPYDESKQELSNIQYGIYDTIGIFSKKYIVSYISPLIDSLRLSEIVNAGDSFGIEVGTVAIPVSGIDLLSKRKVKSTDFKGKYILLDFWGSWCIPCLRSIPELRALSKKFKKELQIISIAVDDEKNLSKVNEIIKSNGMNWIHFCDKENVKEAYNLQYKVNSFPYYILIDRDGRIAKRINDGNVRDVEKLLIEKQREN